MLELLTPETAGKRISYFNALVGICVVIENQHRFGYFGITLRLSTLNFAPETDCLSHPDSSLTNIFLSAIELGENLTDLSHITAHLILIGKLALPTPLHRALTQND